MYIRQLLTKYLISDISNIIISYVLNHHSFTTSVSDYGVKNARDTFTINNISYYANYNHIISTNDKVESKLYIDKVTDYIMSYAICIVDNSIFHIIKSSKWISTYTIDMRFCHTYSANNSSSILSFGPYLYWKYNDNMYIFICDTNGVLTIVKRILLPNNTLILEANNKRLALMLIDLIA